MTAKQNMIFFIGLTIIIVGFFVGGQLKILWDTIFTGPAAGNLAKTKKGKFKPIPPPPLNLHTGVN